MDRLEAFRLFVRVVEKGSFSAVAREAGLGQPAVSKQIAALEAHLGAQLLRRTSRTMSLTEAGQIFYESALRVVSELESAESLVGRGQAAPAGLVRVSVAPVFGRLYVVPRLPAFFAKAPEVRVELIASSRAVSLVEEGLDLAIRHGALADSALVAQPLGSSALQLVASKAYLARRGVPKRLEDLAQHECVVFAPGGDASPWHFAGAVHRPEGSFRTGDGEQIRAAIVAGLGIAQAPSWLVAREVAEGSVRVLLAQHEPPRSAIHAVHAAGRRMPTKVRVLLEFLAKTLAKDLPA